ncbi:RB1-inducible coiled-coil protein 1 isoform X2 [Ictidomys tridecemlineatus]|uniref:RB1-inducible coiled-coil protein 1 isoform X2 n=1 Tax=Ictidomys tridecemlineatus TaxID=43179 RepID=UPI00038C26A3|nr:RB1-inducible coiled-coil protein 1 isoform X2 [Ictidomys tridecemlineatus]KAG3274171.1 RB1 inducible coiled-coil 1, transcript variant X2 [Ictidomys tridecemlineatus]
MKLYVFLVNTGTTLTFDTELTVQTVADLKHAIQSKYKIAIQHQVLVVNGGECMAADRRVCTYSAGTDTNPIFLFNKEMILCDRAPAIPKTTFSTENDMEIKVEESLMMPAVFHTVASRTQLAVEMYEVAKKLCSFCEGLVHDEHLQHQGWAAIMANLEDCSNSYQKLLFKFESIYSNYLQSIEDIKLKLTHLGTAVSVMAKIPLLECLTRHSYRECLGRLDSLNENEGSEKAEMKRSTELVLSPDMPRTTNTSLLTSFHKSVEHVAPDTTDDESGKEIRESCQSTVQQDETSVDTKDGDLPFFNVSLLDWINVQDRPNDVESLVRKCFDSMSRLDPKIIRPFIVECHQTIAKLDNQNMKAIKGLEDRLYALDQMIASCGRLVNEQKELAQGFLANQMRAENLKDASVLPDLCLSHANQLMIMLQNHRKLLDIKQKCTTAKQELANNLHVRLKWCCFVMLHADQDGEKLQALLRLVIELLERVKIVEALSTVPQMYCLAVVEVVRRKMFIKHYREWAGALVKDGKRLYEAEKSKRESFGKLFRKSFLRNRLFRGLDSWPPSFCTQKPRKFDCELPDISLKDLQFLQSFCPSEVQPFLRVPLLCDFEPLHQHVLALHNLVKAAQSLDEMSQTITDLLNEQKASVSQASPQSTSSPRIESATGIATTTSPRTPPPLAVQDPLCPAVCPLEELSPDSIDAHTFDFETIPHPNIEQTIHQVSLDLDSLAESPESDFMSAVNEFVIEENLSSPNPISDPQSPEMMVESLYSSVINAIDSRRMQGTNTCGKEDFGDHASLNVQLEKCRVVAQDSHCSIQTIKEDLCHFRTFVQKEQCDFSNSLKCTALEIRNIIEKVKCSLEITLKEKHQKELQSLKSEYEGKLNALIKESEENENKIKKLKGDLVCLEEVLQNKDNEFALVKHEKEVVICLQNEKDQKLLEMENIMHTQNCEIRELKQSREVVLEDLKKLHVENDEKIQLLRTELQCLEQSHLKELEDTLHVRHTQEFEKVMTDHQVSLEKLKEENQQRIVQIQESHAMVIQEKEQQLQELKVKVSDLSDMRCKLEVELALKEAETDEIKILLEESRTQQKETLKSLLEQETENLRTEISKLNQKIQDNNENYQVGLAELRTLMTIEKDQCISELISRHEEESNILKAELAKVTSLHHQAFEIEKNLKEQIVELQSKLDSELSALEKQKEEKITQQEEKYEAIIQNLEKDKERLVMSHDQDREQLIQKLNCEKDEAIQAALKEFKLEREVVEKELLEKVKHLENQIAQSPAIDSTREDSSSLVAELQEKLQVEKAKFLEQLEEQEKRKNEEMQNVRTSLIAEQQTNFNTVLTREKLRKENIINDLSDKLKTTMQQQERDKDLIESLSEDRARLLEEKKKLEEEVSKLRSSSFVPSAYVTTAPELYGACAPELPGETERSAMETTDEGRVDSAMETSMMSVQENVPMLSEEKQRIMLLERTLQLKEEENKRLNQRLMSQSMSSVSSRHSEKIAIRDFQVGDLVLIILDERHDNYVLFTVSPTLYFLHSESLPALDLKPASGASRRPWVLGKVMEKEYCQAKKAQNRFKVPLGTKFYRVKAVSWNKKV